MSWHLGGKTDDERRESLASSLKRAKWKYPDWIVSSLSLWLDFDLPTGKFEVMFGRITPWKISATHQQRGKCYNRLKMIRYGGHKHDLMLRLYCEFLKLRPEWNIGGKRTATFLSVSDGAEVVHQWEENTVAPSSGGGVNYRVEKKEGVCRMWRRNVTKQKKQLLSSSSQLGRGI